ncbi:hypothetical protein [Tenacibaculum sp. IB213877]|uniref:hypothetical protein n=1 Tax=Tenacibaculum sp. IB213877 TaxID=3097351 RepID=UPI002A5B0B54|nr:hypothetical protein [Tenacibaculum sp. IB213877]MDY0779267.1 hypothetical protein [Tenacibaculum sp. IB213877]
MRFILSILICIIFSSCEHQLPAYNFSNFKNSEIYELAQAVKNNDLKGIRKEVLEKKAKINLTDDKYDKTLLTLAIANDKKEAFKELLKLGANPNYYSVDNCFSPIITAIRLNKNCDLFFIEELLKYDVNLNPGFFRICNSGHYDPLFETIMFFNDYDTEQCCIDILRLLTTKLEKIDLNENNDEENYMQNIVYFCLSTRNLNALHYFIVDLKCKVPDKIFINGTVLSGYRGVGEFSLEDILNSKYFTLNEDLKYLEKQKNKILSYLNK